MPDLDGYNHEGGLKKESLEFGEKNSKNLNRGETFGFPDQSLENSRRFDQQIPNLEPESKEAGSMAKMRYSQSADLSPSRKIQNLTGGYM